MPVSKRRNRVLRSATLAVAIGSTAAIYGVVIANPFPGAHGGGSVQTSAVATTAPVKANVATSQSQPGSAATVAPTATPTQAPVQTTTTRSRTSRGS